MSQTWVWFLGWEDALEQEMATQSSILAWKFHGQRRLVGNSPWNQITKSRTWLNTFTHTHTHRHTSEATTRIGLDLSWCRQWSDLRDQWENSWENAMLSGIWFSVGKRKEFWLECKMNIVGRGMSAHFQTLAKENYQWHLWGCTEGMAGIGARIPEHYLSTLNRLVKHWSRKLCKGLLYYQSFDPQKKFLMQKLREEVSKESRKKSVSRIKHRVRGVDLMSNCPSAAFGWLITELTKEKVFIRSWGLEGD